MPTGCGVRNLRLEASLAVLAPRHVPLPLRRAQLPVYLSVFILLLISTKICLMLIDTKSHTLLLRASNAGWKNAGNASHTVGDTACGQ